MLVPILVCILATLLKAQHDENASRPRFNRMTEMEKLRCTNGFIDDTDLLNIYQFAKRSTFNERPVMNEGNKVNREVTLIDDWLGKGWIGVPFGETGEMGRHIFQIESNRPTFINVADIFCTGDRFRVEAVPLNGIDSSVIMFTSRVAVNNCSSSTHDPDEAWSSELWSTGQMMVPPGNYSVKIYVEFTPYNGGTLAIRADHPFCLPSP